MGIATIAPSQDINQLTEQRIRRAVSKHDSLVFEWESYSNILDELIPLWVRHWDEIALDKEVMPLKPHFDGYLSCEANQILKILTARNKVTKKMVGYCFNLVYPHLHYTALHGHTEMFWLAPEYRYGWNGARMLKANRNGLKELGVVLHTISYKISFEDGRVGNLLERLGYSSSDITMRSLLR